MLPPHHNSLSVWDKDLIGSDDYLGGADISLGRHDLAGGAAVELECPLFDLRLEGEARKQAKINAAMQDQDAMTMREALVAHAAYDAPGVWGLPQDGAAYSPVPV